MVVQTCYLSAEEQRRMDLWDLLASWPAQIEEIHVTERLYLKKQGRLHPEEGVRDWP